MSTSLPTTQKALILDKAHGSFSVGTRPVTPPGPGEILFKVRASGLNPVDWKVQRHNVFVSEYPAVLGSDGAGDVVAVGTDVTGFAIGDRVFTVGTFTPNSGSHQEYMSALAATTGKVPDNLSYEEAATVAVGAGTAFIGLYHSKPYGFNLSPPIDASAIGKYSNTPIVILGGSTSVGQYVIQFAKLSGFSPIIVTSSLRHTDHLKGLGATDVIDRRTVVHEEVAKIVGQDTKIEHVYDAVSSPETQQIAYDLVAPGGKLAITLPIWFQAKEGDDEGKYVVSVMVHHELPHNLEFLNKMYPHLTEWLSKGTIKPNRFELLKGGLPAILGGFERLEKDEVSGVKLVVRPEETE